MDKEIKFMSVKDAMKKGEGEVALRGWVYRFRGSNKIKFLVLRDSTNIIQCVLKQADFSEDLWAEIDKLKIESSVKLIGDIKPDERAPTGFEVSVKDIKIVHIAEDYPINKDLNEDLLGDRRHLWLRSRKMTAIMKIRSTVFGAIHEYFRGEGFTEFQSPILVPGGAEDGPTMFNVDYYGKPMYLCQTWQLYAEAAIFSLEKIYCIAPSFRAEKSNTSRHLSEYWHAEMEVAWANLNEIMDYAESMIKLIFRRVLEKNKEELEILGRDMSKLEPTLNKKFPRITYTEALKILKEEYDMDIPWGKDLRTVEEEKLMELYDTIVFVTHYPKEAMAFYKPKDKDDPRVARCFDALGPEGMGELIGGSERDESLEELEKTLSEKGENLDDYAYYLDTRRYGSIPHAGFGLGTERLIRWICGLPTIKDAIAFPRTLSRSTP